MDWKLEKRKIKDLKTISKNPRRLSKHDAKHLEKSLDKFGVCEPLVINTNNILIGGHQRMRTLKKMGYKEVDVYVPDKELNEKEIEELNIRLNRNAGEWDFDILANEWDVSELIKYGFNGEEFSLDVEEIESEEEDEQGDIELPKDPVTKLGDVYLLGEHRLCCGDSTNPDDVSKLLNGEEPILMVTDPPYGVNYDPKWRKIAGKGTRALGVVENDDKVNWSLAWSLFPGSVAYVWHAGVYCGEVQKSLEEANFTIKNQIVWVKQHFALSRGDYHWKHEPCWYAVKKGHGHNWQGSRKECSVWEIANLNCFGKTQGEDEERTAHSTQKPIDCMLKPIINNTLEGEGVYDPFVGSGTTLIAAEKSKRKAFCMELSPEYCDIIVERWKKYRIKNKKDSIVKKNDVVVDD